MSKIEAGLSFADVIILPGPSDIRSRYGNQIDLSAQFAKGVPELNSPIVSANMDTVTEAPMAMAMALQGGLGVIHRFLTPENQANQVRLVKERMRIMEDKPPMLPETALIQDALNLLQQRERGYVFLHASSEPDGTFSGIATNRDFLAAPPDAPLHQVMTPNLPGRMITVPVGTTLEQAYQIMRQSRIEKVPVVDEEGKLVGVFTTKDFDFRNQHPNAAIDNQGRLMVGAAIGVQPDDVDRAHLLVEAGVDVLVLDIAHGHLFYIEEMIKQLKIKEKIKVPIVAGNVATREGTLYVYESGADGVKVGIGPGFSCETRNVAGVGVPQITAIMNAAGAIASKQQTIPIIADGGIREPGDVGKAIVAGADTVMVGSLLAGTDKSPGNPVMSGDRLVKRLRGMASASAFHRRKEIGTTTTQAQQYTPEGREVDVPYKGETENVTNALTGGLRSTMSYVGAHDITELKAKGKFMQITSAGSSEQKRDLK
jgi:IMP dehydrogenase